MCVGGGLCWEGEGGGCLSLQYMVYLPPSFPSLALGEEGGGRGGEGRGVKGE